MSDEWAGRPVPLRFCVIRHFVYLAGECAGSNCGEGRDNTGTCMLPASVHHSLSEAAAQAFRLAAHLLTWQCREELWRAVWRLVGHRGGGLVGIADCPSITALRGAYHASTTARGRQVSPPRPRLCHALEHRPHLFTMLTRAVVAMCTQESCAAAGSRHIWYLLRALRPRGRHLGRQRRPETAPTNSWQGVAVGRARSRLRAAPAIAGLQEGAWTRFRALEMRTRGDSCVGVLRAVVRRTCEQRGGRDCRDRAKTAKTDKKC